MAKNTSPDIKIEISEEEILRRIDQIETLDIDDDFREFLISALQALVRLDKLIGMKETTIFRLRRIFGKKTERRAAHAGDNNQGQDGKHPRGNNKGRNGAKSYPTAPIIFHSHESLKPGDICPECHKGTLITYRPGIYIRITGSTPLSATVHQTEKLRCSICLMFFEAYYEGRGGPKYDEKAKAIIALLKYKGSFPFYRLEKIQKQLFTPMPASTQWDLMEELGDLLWHIWKCLLAEASTAGLFYQDDTTGKVLSLMKENKKIIDKPKGFRKGIHTTGIGATLPDGRRIILYLTGRKYSGENLADILEKRPDGLNPPIVMSDALAQNNIKGHEVLQVLCNAHGRRKFVDLQEKFKEESDYILLRIGLVYKTETQAKESNLDPQARLALHQKESTAPMMEVKAKCQQLLENHAVEPNSSLGQAIKYMLKHWCGLTEFLRTPGVPLDNNFLEGQLRLAVLNRRNWLFYKTLIGALVGDVITSTIKTCDANNKNSFDYLVWVQKNAEDVRKNPGNYLPWHFNPNSS